MEDGGYIIHNAQKQFKEGHSHIKNYKTAVYLIDLALHKSIPHHLHLYFLETLVRVSTDDTYIRKLQELIKTKREKTHVKYYNSRKKVKR